MIIIMNKKIWNSCIVSTLFLYLYWIYSKTLICRSYNEIQRHNFQPFWSYEAIVADGKDELLMENLLNILLFIPLGLLICFAYKAIKWWQVLLAGFCISISIEVLQFSLKRGFAEFDDIFHNMCGCLLGYLLYVALRYYNDKYSLAKFKRD